MLKVMHGSTRTPQTVILVEGEPTFYGERKLTKEIIENAAELPEGYTVGTSTVSYDGNFWFKVIET